MVDYYTNKMDYQMNTLQHITPLFKYVTNELTYQLQSAIVQPSGLIRIHYFLSTIKKINQTNLKVSRFIDKQYEFCTA